MKPETTKALNNVVTLAELVAKARRAVVNQLEVGRPKDAITPLEYAEGPPAIGVTTARKQLRQLVAEGKYERISAMVPGTDGIPRKTHFFREIQR